jgi:hypothetical protein
MQPARALSAVGHASAPWDHDYQSDSTNPIPVPCRTKDHCAGFSTRICAEVRPVVGWLGWISRSLLLWWLEEVAGEMAVSYLVQKPPSKTPLFSADTALVGTTVDEPSAHPHVGPLVA